MQMRILTVFICACLLDVAFAQGDDTISQLAQDPHASAFVTSDQCIACHSNLHAADGTDVSIGYAWRASMMANAAKDPYWLAAVRREVMENPTAQAAIEDKCSTCHMPMARFDAAHAGGTGEVFANMFRPGEASASLALDGVSCTVCHQISAENFGTEASFTGGFSIDATADGPRNIFGPHDVDTGRQHIMRSAANHAPMQSTHLQQSEMCATCHTLYTHALNADGEEVGELAEQVPYLEWLNSDYRNTASCQDCHMPVLPDPAPIASVLGEPRPEFSQHVFRGGNSFMLGILNKYRGELGVTALPQEFDNTIRRTKEYLASSTANVRIGTLGRVGDNLEFTVVVESLAGHKLPTAYPSRRVWLHVAVEDSAGNVLFESGSLRANGSIVGNANDDNRSAFEPHYDVIEAADQVQIYEPILGDIDGAVTTGLLRGVSYLKDNRILPLGFDKAGAVADIAVEGRASSDGNFQAGGDTVMFRLPLTDVRQAARIRVELLYQTVGYRWARNFDQYPAFETDRFTRFYDESIEHAAVTLANAEALISD